MNKPFNPLLGTAPEATIIADELLAMQTEQLRSRAAVHISGYNKFWAAGVTPAEILAAMGQQGCRWLAGARHSVGSLYQLVQSFNESLPEGEQLDFDAILPPQFREPRLPFVEHPDGTATLESDPLKDPWGRWLPGAGPQPEPESEPEEEPEEEPQPQP